MAADVLLLQTGGTDNLLLQTGDSLLLQTATAGGADFLTFPRRRFAPPLLPVSLAPRARRDQQAGTGLTAIPLAPRRTAARGAPLPANGGSQTRRRLPVALPSAPARHALARPNPTTAPRPRPRRSPAPPPPPTVEALVTGRQRRAQSAGPWAARARAHRRRFCLTPAAAPGGSVVPWHLLMTGTGGAL